METSRWLTQRQATEELRFLGIGRDAARSALQAGIAGPPVRIRSAMLYDADAVAAAVGRAANPCKIRSRSDRPIFVARIAPRTPDPDSTWRSWRGADTTAPVQEQRDAARAWWFLGARTQILTEAIGQAKGMPFVVTCGGIVVHGAEITGFDADLEQEATQLSEPRRAGLTGRARTYARRATAFTLSDPGEWFDAQMGRRWMTGPGGPFRLVLTHGQRPTMRA